MGSKRLTPTRVGKMASKCLLLLLLLLFYVGFEVVIFQIVNLPVQFSISKPTYIYM